MLAKSLVALCVLLLLACGVGGTLVAASAIVAHLSTANTSASLLVGAAGAFTFGVGAITTAYLCARFALVAVWPRGRG
jgi:fucose permease